MTHLNGKDFFSCFSYPLYSDFDLASFDAFLLLIFLLMTLNAVFFLNTEKHLDTNQPLLY